MFGQPGKRARRGLSLLELMVSLAIMAMLLTPLIALLQTSQSVWEDRDKDHSLIEAAHSTVRHIVRNMRQANAVVSITPASNHNGELSIRSHDNRLLTWRHSADRVEYIADSASSVLAVGIKEMWFVGLQRDGVTQTTNPSEIQLVECRVKIQLDRDTNPERTISSTVWMRSY